MSAPVVYPYEDRRLAALRRYHVLDTPSEAGFDRITRLAARWLDVPIALVTLLDADRQWFKSCVGLDLQETPRDVSFCAYNLHSAEPLVVEDATQDPRFADNPLVTGPPGIRFYAGAPLVTPDGYPLGSLCVIDTVPRAAATVDLATLRDLADTVVTELELRAANDRLQARNGQVQALTRELRAADETTRSQLSVLVQEGLQQVLQAARMKLENVAADPGLPASHAERLQRVSDDLGEALDATRNLSARFAPAVGTQSLRDTLEWLAGRMQDVHGLSVTVCSTEPVVVGSEALRTLLYRVVRELLFSARRQGGTGAVRVHLCAEADTLSLIVEDEGGRLAVPADLDRNEAAPTDRSTPAFSGPSSRQNGSERPPLAPEALARRQGVLRAPPPPSLQNALPPSESLWAELRAYGGSVHCVPEPRAGTQVTIQVPLPNGAYVPRGGLLGRGRA
jgi:signal transduction histidine kinase